MALSIVFPIVFGIIEVIQLALENITLLRRIFGSSQFQECATAIVSFGHNGVNAYCSPILQYSYE